MYASWVSDYKPVVQARHIPVLLLLAACNAEDDGPVARAANSEQVDADTGHVVETDAGSDQEADAGSDTASDELIRSRLAETLASDDFRDATCRLAGAVAAAEDASLSCEELVATCLDTVGSIDASVPLGPGLPDTTLELPECDVSVAQLDACLAELGGVVIELSSEVECGADAGGFASSIGPEALLQAPSCLLLATTCPALLELFLASMPA